MMKSVAAIEPEVAPLERFGGLAREEIAPAVAAPTRFADYLELTKPRIAVMALFTVAVGYVLAAGASTSMLVLFHTLFGAGLVAAGGSSLNQWLERRIDSRMYRTRKRPLLPTTPQRIPPVIERNFLSVSRLHRGVEVLRPPT